MKPLDRIVWIDLETTGLDPETDQILEVGLVVTTGAMALNEIAAEHWTIRPANGLTLNRFVFNMHAKNGLLAELGNGDPLADVDAMVAGTIHSLDAAGGPIAGSTVHFDRKFIDRHMPQTAKCFSYRVFDVSTLKQAQCQARVASSADDGAAAAHRALDDIRYSIEVARGVLLELGTRS